MKLTLLVHMTNGQGPGDTFEAEDEAEALRMIASRFAVPFVEKQIERAVTKLVVEKRKKDHQNGHG